MFLGHNIKFLRKKENFSQEQFAKIFGLKRSNIGSYEEGRATPPLQIIIKVAKYFNLKIETLISEDISKLLIYPDMQDTENFVNAKHERTELSSLVVKSHPASKALEEMLVSAIALLAGKIREGMDEMILERIPQLISKQYNSLVSSDENISRATRENFLNELKKELDLN
jgi:transcriptional regulator with XRE-family HTH domain